MSASSYVQRLVVRHTQPLSVRPRTMPRFAAPSTHERVDTPRAIARRVDDETTPERRTVPGRSMPNAEPDIPRAAMTEEPVAHKTERSRSADADRGGLTPDHSFEVEAMLTKGRLKPTPTYEDEQAPTHEREPASTVGGLKPAPAYDTNDAERPTGRRREVRAEPPRPSQRRGVERQPAPRSAEPETIHVHIGRVDVRAIVPQPSRQPPPRPAGPQPLSLDDYLARRSGR